MIDRTKWIAAIFVVALLSVAGIVQAQEPTPADGADTAVVVEPAVVDASCNTCGPQYCITYHKHCLLRRVCCDCCVPPYQTVLKAKVPCSCCEVDIPVCVPGCCTDAPCVTCRPGLFGRVVTEYTWCCGFKVRIVATRRGTIAVHTYGG